MSPAAPLIVWTLIVLSSFQATACLGSASGVRPPAVAGSFYPDDPQQLAAAVQAFLDDALPAQPERPLGLVVPHAGYIYSGQICADALAQAAGRDYDVVVILGTNHRAPAFGGVSVFAGKGYRTPLGTARIDQDLTSRLLFADDRFTYRSSVHEQEHSVEVQVPFVQTVFPDLPLVTAVIGRPDPQLCRDFGIALAEALRDRRPLILASSDLSHYPAHDDAVEADSAVLQAIASLDPDTVQNAVTKQMRRGLPGLSTCACGEGPILALLTAADRLGAGRASVISYANSGDTVLGDRDRVVGYGAVAITTGDRSSDTAGLQTIPVAGSEAALQATDRAALLAFARRTIDQYLHTGTVPLARGFSPVLNRRQGAFVTLHMNGALRGCIGHMAEDTPLGQVVGAMALQAAFNDQRFSPLQPREWPQVDIEISVLTPFTPIPGPEAITVGRDGVLLRKGGRQAVFLPQVAPEQGWNREQMLENLCRKAGLPAGSWRDDAELLTFQAVVFSESEEP